MSIFARLEELNVEYWSVLPEHPDSDPIGYTLVPIESLYRSMRNFIVTNLDTGSEHCIVAEQPEEAVQRVLGMKVRLGIALNPESPHSGGNAKFRVVDEEYPDNPMHFAFSRPRKREFMTYELQQAVRQCVKTNRFHPGNEHWQWGVFEAHPRRDPPSYSVGKCTRSNRTDGVRLIGGPYVAGIPAKQKWIPTTPEGDPVAQIGDFLWEWGFEESSG